MGSKNVLLVSLLGLLGLGGSKVALALSNHVSVHDKEAYSSKGKVDGIRLLSWTRRDSKGWLRDERVLPGG